MSFSDFNLDPSLRRAIADLGFKTPTAIQRDGLPPGLAGRDVLACAMTGSGKTAAFVLPMLQRLLGTRRGTTRGLVVAPTRELAQQIVDHFNELARHTRLRAAAVHGGVSMGPQETAFRRGVDVLVACPGRLLDHLSRPYANLDGVEVLVLDEADRMLDMGFLPDIRRILKRLPPLKQTLLFSATLPPPIVTLARELLRDPAILNIERPSAPAVGVQQTIFPIRDDLKRGLLLELLRRDEIANALVFTRTKHRANRLAQFLDKNGVACERIHGNRTQSQRTRALAGFRRGQYRVLVATDVAARGIDIEALSHVVNFDVPKVPEDYIHRVGRTARAGATGEALTFVSHQEQGDLRAIERAVKKSLPRRTLDDFDYSERVA
jgi:ATP-dependent RNA helicase RhlE